MTHELQEFLISYITYIIICKSTKFKTVYNNTNIFNKYKLNHTHINNNKLAYGTWILLRINSPGLLYKRSIAAGNL